MAHYLKVGDRVRATEAAPREVVGKVGAVVDVEPGRMWPIVVTFDGGDPMLEDCPLNPNELEPAT